MMKDVFSHFGEISDDAKKFSEDVVFLDSRYVFVNRVKGQQFGFCTHCKFTFKTSKLKHNQKVECTNCNSNCKVKQAGMGRKYMQDDAYFVHFEKSRLNKDTITAIGYYAERDYSRDYKNIVTKFERLALYIFSPGNAVMYTRSVYEDETHFIKRKSVFSLHNTSIFGHKDGFLSLKSVEKAIKDTPFMYSTWEHYDISYLIKFFGLYAKYPSIELLTKVGLSDVVEDKLRDLKTFRAINWRGKNLTEILRINKQDWKCIPDCSPKFTSFKLHMLQEVRKEGAKLSVYEVNEACEQLNLFSYLNAFNFLRNYTGIRKILNYVQRQYSMAQGTYYSRGSVLSTWHDYLRECIEFGQDLNKKSVIFPKNLYESHQRNIEKQKAIANEKLNIGIVKHSKTLNKYSFQYGNFFIRPIESVNELIIEGEKLNHCVGGYSKNYSEGKTNLFVIRHIEAPNRPFYTLELISDTITQCYGMDNRVPTEEVETFLSAFRIERLGEKQNKLAAV